MGRGKMDGRRDGSEEMKEFKGIVMRGLAGGVERDGFGPSGEDRG